MAPVVIGIFFLASIQLLFMGVLGEYVGAIHTQVQHRPYAVELERINFEFGPGAPLRAGDLQPHAAVTPSEDVQKDACETAAISGPAAPRNAHA
jgi:hypothetical protein